MGYFLSLTSQDTKRTRNLSPFLSIQKSVLTASLLFLMQAIKYTAYAIEDFWYSGTERKDNVCVSLRQFFEPYKQG